MREIKSAVCTLTDSKCISPWCSTRKLKCTAVFDDLAPPLTPTLFAPRPYFRGGRAEPSRELSNWPAVETPDKRENLLRLETT